MQYVGNIVEDETVNVFFTTNDSSGAAVAPSTAFEAADIAIYKDNSATQKTTTNGLTMTSPFDAVVGLHLITIDTSNDTGDVGFWVTGSDYTVILNPDETVDGQTIVSVLAQFSIQNKYMRGTDSAALASVATEARLAELDAANIPADVDAILTDTGTTIPAQITALNNLSAAQVNAEADTALADFFTSSAQLVDDVWDEVLTAAAHNVATSAGRRLRTLQDDGNYTFGAVWLDTNGANTGSTFPDDGTFLNPVNTLARAITVASAATQPIKRFFVMNGSSITLTSTFSGYEFNGQNWTLALGGQDISNSKFLYVSGGITGIATGTFPFFYESSIGNATLPPCAVQTCGFTGTLTVGSAGDYYLVDCFSQVAGTSTPIIDMGAAVGATNISVRRWSGGLTINNLASGDVVSIDAISGGTITLNGADATVHVRGMVNVVNNLTGSPTVVTTNNMDARFDSLDTATAAILVDTNELQGDWTDGGRLDLIADAILADTNELQTDNIPGLIAALNDITVADILAATIETGYDVQAVLRLIGAACAGKLSGAATATNTIRSLDDSVDRITATVDASGNRSAVTHNI